MILRMLAQVDRIRDETEGGVSKGTMTFGHVLEIIYEYCRDVRYTPYRYWSSIFL